VPYGTSIVRYLSACAAVVAGVLLVSAAPARASETLCDSSYQNCRTPLLNYINAEKVEIDVGLWFIEDNRYVSALINRFNAGVRVRILMDPRASSTNPYNQANLDQLKAAGVPMMKRTAGGIEHWKMMLFAGQNQVYFGSANFSADAFVPVTPYINYVDETVYFTNKASVVNSFKTKFDDAWVDSSSYAPYANVSSRSRSYPVYSIDPELNFPPGEDFANRSVKRYNAETQQIDVLMFRITDQRHTDAIINAHNRGVPVRMIVDPTEYRNAARLWDAWNVDRLYAAGITMRSTVHQGINHGKLVLLHGQAMTIFGSSNWTSPSANSQHEHNYFTKDSVIYQWFLDQFERKWHNSTGNKETGTFTPLPPDKPVYQSPSNGATGASTTVTLKWYAGVWAHNYDIYFGTDPNPPLFAANVNLGPSQASNDYKTYTLPPITGGTTYYWKIVSKTMANVAASGPIWSFTTGGSQPPPSSAPTVVIWTSSVPSGSIHGNWTRIADSTAAGGSALQNTDRGAGKIAPALSSPSSYFDASFPASKGTPYHLWVRLRAQGNSTSNDSIHVQFNDSTDSLGSGVMRIGTTSSAEVVLQAEGGSAPHGWGWSDNGWGSLGTNIYFANTGTHTVRVQQREDGAIVDQIVLSPSTYYSTPPGGRHDDTTILSSTTGGTIEPPPSGPSAGTLVLWAAHVPSGSVHNWTRLSDSTAAGGSALWNVNAGAAKIAPALAAPSVYFQTTFTAPARTAYHVWVRMRAEGNSVANDSVHIQFSDSVTSGGSATMRIGTTSSAEFVLQDGPSGGAPSGWGWTENGWGSLGPHVYFAATGTHTLRVQQREDGAIIDQIVLSPDTYLSTAPGSRQNDKHILAENTGGSTSAQALPSPWSQTDIGQVGSTGSASYASGTFTVRAAGADIWGAADAFHYVFHALTGDGSIQARVASLTKTASWTKAGVMIRETLSAASAQALMLVSASKGVAFQRRTVTGGASTNTAGSSAAAPRWVRLERSGSTVTGLESRDGITWSKVGSDTIPMRSTVYVGLAVTSHADPAVATATFDDVSGS